MLDGMGEAYWDGLAESYQQEIFSVLKNDKAQIIKKLIHEYGDKNGIVGDIGCGVGHFLPLLSKSFSSVRAYDLSNSLLEKAKFRFKDLDNIIFEKRDFSNQKQKVKKHHFLLCVNVLIMPSLKTRMLCLQQLQKSLVKGGSLLLVVPSIESSILTQRRDLEWNLKKGLSYNKSIDTMDANSEGSQFCKQGLADIDGELTKHYLAEELDVLLGNEKFEIVEMKKLEYSWDTEFNNPPAWMKAPYPWDWCVLAKKR